MRSPKPSMHVWAYKGPVGRVTVHRGDDTRFTDVDGWLTVCNRIVGAGLNHPADYRWIWAEFRTLNPAFVSLCKRCWK